MSDPITAKSILDFLKVELANHLGTYRYPNKLTTPAIRIGDTIPPSGITITGLEVIIPFFPTTSTNSVGGGTASYSRRMWHLQVIDRGGNDNSNTKFLEILQSFESSRAYMGLDIVQYPIERDDRGLPAARVSFYLNEVH
jgi:hypothetical protein